MEKIRRPSGVRNENGRRGRKDLSPFRLFDKGISKESYSAGCQPVCSLAPRLVLIKLFPRSPASPLPPRPPKNRLENPEREIEREISFSPPLFLCFSSRGYLDISIIAEQARARSRLLSRSIFTRNRYLPVIALTCSEEAPVAFNASSSCVRLLISRSSCSCRRFLALRSFFSRFWYITGIRNRGGKWG